MAKVFCDQNPNGGTGYTFGGLLSNYLFFKFIYYTGDQIQENLFGGDSRHHKIQGGNHETIQGVTMSRPGAEDVQGTLHWVRGGHLVRSGAGHVYDRVTKSLSELLGDAYDPNMLYLCYGTSIEHASNILETGPLAIGRGSADFGRAFYVTDSFEYAVYAGHQVTLARTDTTVLVYPVPRSAITEERALKLSDGEAWQNVIRKSRRGTKIPDAAQRAAYKKAECIIGPISENAHAIDTGEQAARASRFQQWAFTDEEFAEEVFTGIVEQGSVHVFRITHEQENEWERESKEAPQL